MIGVLASDNNVWKIVAIAFGSIITGEKIISLFFKEKINKDIKNDLTTLNKNILINQQESNSGDDNFFNKLTKDQQWNIIKSLLDFYNYIVAMKMSVLPLLSALSVAMVVVLTLNKELINFDILSAKTILSILLFLIPISLIIFIKDIEKGAKGVRYDIEKYLGKVETNPNIFDWISSYTPIVIVIFYFLMTIYFLYKVWF